MDGRGAISTVALVAAVVAMIGVFLAPADVRQVGLGVLLLTAFGPWLHAWRRAEGTALRGGLIWAVLALGLAIGSQAAEATASSKMADRSIYVASLAVLAALAWPFNARRPGVRAWGWLTGCLVLVLLIPWLGASDAMRRGAASAGSVRLHAPWSLFYLGLGAAGVANYVPTRFRTAALILGAGLACEFAGVAATGWSAEARADARAGFALSLGVAAWSARRRLAGGGTSAATEFDRTWLGFRDRWGAAWGLRIRDQFNRSATLAGWPFRLNWDGLEAVEGASPGDPAAEARALATLRGLLRRFIAPGRPEG